MHKRMPVAALKPGMYVVEISQQTGQLQVRTEGWLKDQAAIDALAQLGIVEVVIDLARHDNGSPLTSVKPVSAKPATAGTTPTASASFERELIEADAIYGEALQLLDAALLAAKDGRPLPTEPLRAVVKQSMASLLRNQNALLCLAHLRDSNRYLLEHAINTSILMTVFARALKFSDTDVEALALGALWHDIGKIRVAPAILNKRGRLTAEETREMQRHVEYGLAFVQAVPGIDAMTRAAISEHHERMDGNGYPGKLRAEAISRAGRMMAIVDSYDALTGVRVYRGAVTAVRAFKTLRADSYALYEAELVMAFIKAIGFYPAGSLVKLRSQRLAMVIAVNAGKPYQPLVKVFYHGRFRQSLPVQDLDLAAPDCDDDIEAAVRPEQFKLDLLQFFRTVVLPT